MSLVQISGIVNILIFLKFFNSMINPLFLSTQELRELTGFALKDKQIAQLRIMGIAFRINGCGKPVVTRAAVEGGQSPVAATTQAWKPAVLQGGRRVA